ncbi:unnamed protein product [Arabidopsis arenosa]|uniref:N-acetyltransferase ESCO acetyl-transferase domain-containing protein n=1 Tax=Arabidopsis arenosa TaxID=38785 RepID=A0A8S1ZE91_ARAAE|nr:unnamed protein product [Arabidopsis arenosa]
MQAKINSFFKPSSSSSSISSPVTSADTEHGLAVWENNRNAIVNTYERLRYPIVLKGCIGKPSFNKNRIIVVSENDSPAHRNKVQEVVKMMEVELGEDWILHQHCKVYLFISTQRISGCLVAEPTKEAFKLIASPDDEKQLQKESTSSPSTSIQFGNIVLQREVSKRCRASDDRLDYGAIVCEEEAKPAVCGIRAIWASPSNRRKGIATWLLDTTRESFCNNGCMLEKSQLAFSQPSTMGRSFGSNYFGTCSFLVYKAQLIDTHFS